MSHVESTADDVSDSELDDTTETSHVESTADDVSDSELDDTTEMMQPAVPANHSGYEPLHDASVYETAVDPTDENDAHSLMVRLAGENKRVLELGCATGSTTKILQERGCRVVGIEIDPEAAQLAEQFSERVIVGDLDLLDFDDVLGDDTFDVIIAADVLEHLRNPLRVMTACIQHLGDQGEVLLSIPNIAHADSRLALLRGEFDYQEWGLLDETHLRFFTRHSLQAFLDDCGLVALDWDRTHRPVGGTEIAWRTPHDESLIGWVATQPDADTYQFIVRAAAAPVGSHLHQTRARLREVTTDNAGLRTQVEQLDADVGSLVAQIGVLTAEIESLTTEKHTLLHAAAESNSVIAELREIVVDVETRCVDQLAASRAELSAIERDVEDKLEEVRAVSIERDQYRSSFETLVGVQNELVAVRRSESFRLGRALLAPGVLLRRVTRAWRKAKPLR